MKNLNNPTFWNKATVESVQKAIDLGADVNAKSDAGETVLVWAANYNNNPNVAKLLINAGANVNAKDENGVTALMWAVRCANPDIIKLLINAGADVNAKDDAGDTALMVEVQWGNVSVCQLLELSVLNLKFF